VKQGCGRNEASIWYPHPSILRSDFFLPEWSNKKADDHPKVLWLDGEKRSPRSRAAGSMAALDQFLDDCLMSAMNAIERTDGKPGSVVVVMRLSFPFNRHF
jgi:hypothetical protein